MLFKTALRSLKRNFLMNFICLTQLAAVFIIAAVMVSAMSVRYKTYAPIKSILGENGIFSSYHMIFFGALKPGGNPNTDAVFSEEELCGYMNADRAILIQEQVLFYQDKSLNAVTYFYDDEMLRRWNPGIKRGRWLSDNTENSDKLEIVIPEGAFGLDIGDEAELIIAQYHREGSPVKVKVVGILEDDAKILGETSGRLETGDTYRYLYRPVNDISNTVFCASSGAVKKLYPNADELYIIASFCFYGDEFDDLENSMKTAASMSAGVSLPLSEINKNSKEYLQTELMKLLPIVIILLVLTIVSSISVSALSARRRLKDYAKYYVLGLQWKHCAVINLLQSLIAGSAALIISCAVLAVISAAKFSGAFMIILNIPMVLTLLGIFAVYLVFSMIMPVLMLRSVSPKALLQTE